MKVNTSQENRKELERCIEKLKKLCFPTQEGGKNVVVTITLIVEIGHRGRRALLASFSLGTRFSLAILRIPDFFK